MIKLKICTVLALAMCLVGLPAAANESSEHLAETIRKELVTLPNYTVWDNIKFRVDKDNSVTLMGEVHVPTLKSAAERVVAKIEEVGKIRNEIEVLPTSPNDDRIRLDVYRAVYGQPSLQRYQLRAVPPIHIVVKNGHVSLEGVVATSADKNVAGLQANGVSGVFSVENNLRVEQSS